MGNYSKCNKCNPEPCKCHPCYSYNSGNCNNLPCDTNSTPVDPCYQPSCEDGCEEYINSDCVIVGDSNLTEVINNIYEDCCNTNPDLGRDLTISFNCRAGLIFINGNTIGDETIFYVNIYDTTNNSPQTFPINPTSTTIPYNFGSGLNTGIYFFSFIGNSGQVSQSTLTVDCDDSSNACLDPIADLSLSYDCVTNAISGLAPNVSSVTIDGNDYENNQPVMPSLTDGNTYSVTFNPVDTNCSSSTVNIEINCACDDIISPFIEYDCKNGFITFGSDSGNVGSVTLIGSTQTYNNVENNENLVLPVGAYGVKYNHIDPSCTPVAGILSVTCPCTVPQAVTQNNIGVKVNSTDDPCTITYTIELAYEAILGDITFNLNTGIINVFNPANLPGNQGYDEDRIIQTVNITPSSTTSSTSELFEVTFLCNTGNGINIHLTWLANYNPETGEYACQGSAKLPNLDCSSCT